MATVRRPRPTPDTPPTAPPRLPVRWGLIGLAAVAAGAVALAVGGPIAAIATGCLTVTTMHKILD